jgi:hypothetical protein
MHFSQVSRRSSEQPRILRHGLKLEKLVVNLRYIASVQIHKLYFLSCCSSTAGEFIALRCPRPAAQQNTEVCPYPLNMPLNAKKENPFRSSSSERNIGHRCPFPYERRVSGGDSGESRQEEVFRQSHVNITGLDHLPKLQDLSHADPQPLHSRPDDVWHVHRDSIQVPLTSFSCATDAALRVGTQTTYSRIAL